jgi:glycosyltransferase involved in cell wall biosynthesis/peptidoglycan/xylan/chitin deacetylase (PgdA/CDA1 family)
VLRPMLPWRVRIGLRRWLAAYRRAEHAGVWPIDERAGGTPPNWPGWPEGKRFAFVLSHDVEGEKGRDRVKRLAELDARHGFRASFNFVPEGGYLVTDALREELERAGCEVGVHGLSHDGRMYFSKGRFAREVGRIREYVTEWGASGFRSPLMHHHMSWMHLLGTEYDASTFDTDPFEPMPDGAETIFPFWIRGEDGRGLVELPYTLVQDFTLFKVLEERTVDIWKRKLDWVAERGGMALLNTHPDYMCMGGKHERDEYPAALYEEFLEYATRRYGGEYWHGTPREVARYYTSAVPAESRNTRRRVCMITHSFYENDNRVRRYAETLAKRGDRVEVYALSDGATAEEEEISGVRVFRIQKRRHEEKGKWGYFWPLLRFLTVSSVKLTRRHGDVRYDLIHVHNIPDFLVFAAWYPKWTGVKVILDIHDIVPELFANKFRAGPRGLLVWTLKLMERVSTAFADHVIIANHLWHERLVERSVAAEKCSVVLNHVDDEIFHPRRRTRDDGKVVIIFPGSFQWHQGLDIAVRALARVRERVPGAELHLYGGGGGARAKSDLLRLAEELGLDGSVKFPGSVRLHDIPVVVANADVGIVPKRADSFGNEAYSTKIMEFMSQGIPVVASRTKIDEYYFDEKEVQFFPSGDSEAMAAAIVEVLENGALRERLVKAGREYVERNSWKLKKGEYLDLVDRLTTESFKGVGLRDWRSTRSIR